MGMMVTAHASRSPTHTAGIFLAALAALTLNLAHAQAHDVDLYFFYGDGCPYCDAQKTFLLELQEAVPSVIVHAFEVYSDTGNQRLLSGLAQNHGRDVRGVPATFIGQNVLIGFDNRTATIIRDLVNQYTRVPDLDPTQYPSAVDPSLLANASPTALTPRVTPSPTAADPTARAVTGILTALALAVIAIVIARTTLKRD